VLERLPFLRIAAYGFPYLGIGLVGAVIAFYFDKFSTDTLLIPPAVIGVIRWAFRILDAVNDPVVGYLSDHTQAALGRRRPWVFASAVPLACGLIMLWSPPSTLGLGGLVLWLALGFFIFETAQTLFLIPWGAVGLELTTRYPERTRLFTWQHSFLMTGTLGGIAVCWLIGRAEQPRTAVAVFALAAGVGLAASILGSCGYIRERPEHQQRSRVSVRTAFADVLRNPHARTLLALFAIENLGVRATFSLIPYVGQYVLGRPDLGSLIALAYLLPQALIAPLWIAFAQRVHKKNAWLAAFALSAIAYAVQFFYTAQTSALTIGMVSVALGLAAGVSAVCGSAIKADVVDYDEYVTGGRKEGSYLGLWNLAGKVSSGVTPLLALVCLEVSGYVPNQTQSEATQSVLLLFFGLFPALCFTLGALLLARFRLNRTEHHQLREALDQRGPRP
jgi:GPH family glycoside/pentoside/hexuronide:cation symporter